MKAAIKFNADATLLPLIQSWQDWLLKERLYSEHTLDGYSRDLAAFLANIKDSPLSKNDLSELDVHDFRKFLSKQAARSLNKSSMCRELSAVKNFFKWLERKKILKNPAGANDWHFGRKNGRDFVKSRSAKRRAFVIKYRKRP